MILAPAGPGNDRLSPGGGRLPVSCLAVVAGDEVVDGLKQAVAALRRERADIDEKIRLLESTLAQLEDPESSTSGGAPVEDPMPPQKKTRRPRKKKAPVEPTEPSP